MTVVEQPMMIVPSNPSSNISIMKDGKHIIGRTRPVFSFSYDAIQFSMNVRSYFQGQVEYQMTESQIAEVLQFLQTLDVSEERSRRYAENQRLLDYLRSTDWYVIRKEETGVAIPQDILDERERARQAIDWS